MFASFLEKRAIRDPGWNAWAAGNDLHEGNTAAGKQVTTSSAMQLLAVYGSMSLISDLISQLPVDHYRKQGKTRTEVQPRAAWLDQPNPELDGQECIGQFIAALLSAGNSYEVILRNSTGQVAEIWPQDPADVIRTREVPGGPIVTYIRGEQFRGELLHTRGFTLPGQLLGCNPISYAREAIGSGLAAQEYGATFFSEGATPGIVIDAPGGPDTVDAKKLREGLEQFHKGSGKAHRALALTGGAHAYTLSISPADAQFLEGRNYTAAEIATTLYRIPPDLVGVVLQGSKDVTYQNIEQRWTELRRRCLGYWITKFEKSRTKLTPGPQYIRLNDDAYLRADLLSRYKSYEIAIASKFMLPNEARSFEDWEPIPGGDKFTEPPPVAAPAPIPPPTTAPRMDLNITTPDVTVTPNFRFDAPIHVHQAELPAPEVRVEPQTVVVNNPPAEITINTPEPRAETVFREVIRDDDGTITGIRERRD